MNTLRLNECFYANQQAKQTLAAFIDGGRIVHGILLTGERGLGKKTFARLMAAAFLCREQDAPCLHCVSCNKILAGNHPDVITYSGDGEKVRSFHIETVRELRRKALLKPNEAAIKVFILANCDTMTAQAQNALLKLLEEPPADTMFILTAASRGALLDTVLSRLTEIRIQPLDTEECAERLLMLHHDIDKQRVEEAARLCGGNLGRAQDILLNNDPMVPAKLAMGVLNATAQNEYALLLALGAAAGDRTLFVQMLDRLMLLCRDILAAKLGSHTTLTGETLPPQVLSGITRAKAMRMIESAQTAQRMLLQNAQIPLVASWLSSRFFS